MTAHLTLALDVFTHSAVAFRLTLVSDTVGRHRDAAARRDDAAADAGRLGTGDGMALPGSARPASSRSSPGTGSPGCRSSRRRPSPPTTGRSTRTTLSWTRSGCWAATSCRPGRCGRRTRRPVERAFGALRSLLFEHLPGYAGVDVADRGADPEAGGHDRQWREMLVGRQALRPVRSPSPCRTGTARSRAGMGLGASGGSVNPVDGFKN